MTRGGDMSDPDVAYPLVRLTWVDISTDAGWHSPTHRPPCPTCVSVGYLLHEDAATLWMAAGMGGGGDDLELMDVTSYPRGCIVRIERLDVPATVGV